MKKHELDFKKMSEHLTKNGFKEKDVTLTSKKATVLGLLYSLPFVIAFGLIYRLILINRASLVEIGGMKYYLTVCVVVIGSIIFHELLHGVGWSLSSGKGWNVIRFNISALMPSCACKVSLKKQQYLIGVLSPLCVLGILSIVFLFVYPGTISMLTMIVNFVAAGADLVIAANVLREKDVLIADHPTEAGYVAFYK